VKTKPSGRVEIVQDGNNELIVGDYVFQLGELIDSYRVALSNDLKKSYFCIAENIFFVVDVEELNDVLSSNGHTQVYEDDSDKINI
jgi:hypothetical protein